MPNQKNKFNIANTTKGKLPRLPFMRIKNAALGKNFSLSLVFVGDALSKKLNYSYRHKNRPANVLSFPLGKNEGEIFINLMQAWREAPRYERSFPNFVGFLFIHGCIHLKGFKHSSRMEGIEKKLRRKFRI